VTVVDPEVGLSPFSGLFVRKLSSVKHSIHKTSYFLYLKPPIVTVSKDWEAYYWAPLGECFEQESRGPCQEGQYFSFNLTSRKGLRKIGLNMVKSGEQCTVVFA
jgi:hypothetical protein